MKIIICSVGKLKENFYTAAQAEYLKRLSRFTKTQILEVPEERQPGPSASDIRIVTQEEGKRLLKASSAADFKIALSPDGHKIDSLQFASMVAQIALNGHNAIGFLIGGSYGLNGQTKTQCDASLSFSDMTFNHQLFRIMLLEQIYRAFKINANETYHK